MYKNVDSSFISDSQKLDTYPDDLLKCEKLDKLWHIRMMEYDSIKSNELLIQAATWMSLKEILLSEKSQSQKDMYYMILFI